MALNVFELFGKIAVDSSGAKKGINDTVKHAKGAEDKLSKTFKKIGGMVAAAFSVRAIVDFGKQCTDAYASIAAEESAFAQIMGDYADTAHAKLNAVSDATGVSATRMTGAMTSLTAKFKGLGYNVEDATTLAADGLLIASDAAAFWDMSLDESMSHLNSFINGSYEGGEAIGLFANDTQMAAYAVEQGIVKDAKAWAALDEATKQATRLAYAKNMMEQSGATGQAAKEADSYANVMANLKESWRQFQGVIGKPILEKIVLPAMKKLNDFLPKLTEGVQNGIVWLEEGFDKIKSYFDEVFTEDGINLDALPDALTNMFRDLGRSVGGMLSNFGQKLRSGWSNTVWPMIQKTFKAVFGIELPDWATVKQNISDGWNNTVWPAIQGLFKTVFGVELPSWSQLITDISDSWNNTVWPAIKGFFSAIFTVKPEDEDGQTTGQRIADWWNNKCKPWFATLFEATFEVKPEDADGTEVGKKIRDWWELCKTSIGDIFKATFHVDPGDGYDVGAKIRDMWDKTNEIIGDAFKRVFTVDPEDPDGKTTAQRITDWWNSVKTSFSANIFRGFFGIDPEEDAATTANRIIEWGNSVLKYVGDLFKGFFGVDPEEDSVTTAKNIITWWNGAMTELGESFFRMDSSLGLPSINNVINEIKKWWSDITSSISLSLSAIWDGITGAGGSPPKSTGGSAYSIGGGTMNAFMNDFSFDSALDDKIPAFATGLDYVPRDNYLARLHQGEAVLTRNEADAWRSGAGTGRVEAALSQMADLLRDIAQNTGADKAVVLDTGAAVGALTPRINQRLGNLNRLNARG